MIIKINLSKIKYIHVYPYNYGVPFHRMIHDFVNSKYGKIIPHSERENFKQYMYQYLTAGTGYNRYTVKRTKINKRDIRISKEERSCYYFRR